MYLINILLLRLYAAALTYGACKWRLQWHYCHPILLGFRCTFLLLLRPRVVCANQTFMELLATIRDSWLDSQGGIND
jgi:hypothetical protein